MAEFNPIKDLIPVDPLMESNTLSAEQIESLKSKFEETKNGVSNVLSIIKAKNALLDRDLSKIKSLNFRLKSTIPRIPMLPGKAGVEFSELAKARRKQKGGGFDFPSFPFLIPDLSKRKPKTKTTFKNKKLKKVADTLKTAKDVTLITGATVGTVSASQQLGKRILSGGGRNIPKKFSPNIPNKVKVDKKDKSFLDRIFGFFKGKSKGKNATSGGEKPNPFADTSSKTGSKKRSRNRQETLPLNLSESAMGPGLSGANPLITQLRSGNVSKSGKLYKILGLDDKFTRNNFANYLEPANPKFQAKILRELGLIKGNASIKPSNDTFRFIMNAFKPSDFMLQQIKSGKLSPAIDPRINIFNKLSESGYKIKLDKIVPKKDFDLLKKGLKLEDMPFKKDDKQLDLLQEVRMLPNGKFERINAQPNNKPLDISSLNIDTGVTNTVIILTDPPVA